MESKCCEALFHSTNTVGTEVDSLVQGTMVQFSVALVAVIQRSL